MVKFPCSERLLRMESRGRIWAMGACDSGVELGVVDICAWLQLRRDEHTANDRGQSKDSNPLDVSPANPEVSKGRDEMEGGAHNNAGNGRDRGTASGAGKGVKHGKRG